jgi:hypothetical protein
VEGVASFAELDFFTNLCSLGVDPGFPLVDCAHIHVEALARAAAER